MLKSSTPEMQGAVLKLFNNVLQSGYFPDIWCKGLISPIHKSRDKSDPNNNGGICVSSCLGKLFCSILNKRILDFLEEHSILSKSKTDFLPKHRTTDHVCTLHTFNNKHVHQTINGKIFACFIDFKKAFDLFGMKGSVTGSSTVVKGAKCMICSNHCIRKICVLLKLDTNKLTSSPREEVYKVGDLLMFNKGDGPMGAPPYSNTLMYTSQRTLHDALTIIVTFLIVMD